MNIKNEQFMLFSDEDNNFDIKYIAEHYYTVQLLQILWLQILKSHLHKTKHIHVRVIFKFDNKFK